MTVRRELRGHGYMAAAMTVAVVRRLALVAYAVGLVMNALSREGTHAWQEWWMRCAPAVVALWDASPGARRGRTAEGRKR